MKILAIETSCDETAAAVVEDGKRILSNRVASQAEIHERYGGNSIQHGCMLGNDIVG